MSTRRSAIGSSTATSKRPAAAEKTAPMAATKKRVALADITNLPDRGLANAYVASGRVVRVTRNCSRTSVTDTSLHRNPVVVSSVVRPTTIAPSKLSSFPAYDDLKPSCDPSLAPCSTALSPTKSNGSFSMDESMSSCDSMKSPEFEYIDNSESSIVASLERRATNNLRISEDPDSAGCTRKRDFSSAVEVTGNIVKVDYNIKDPELCTNLACDIYKHLRAVELMKRPSTDYMERIQKDISTSMRSILIDWLVEVSEEYRFVSDTLFLTVNYVDRYLSGNEINRQRLQLLGVACMLIAAKYEEISAPQVEEFCFITDNTYFKDEVLQMEADVLKFLKFELTAPTVKCFLRRFVHVAQGYNEIPLLHSEFLASYLAELSLLEYNMLHYSPSLIAASSIFLARFILRPTMHPWNSTLCRDTLYKPSELQECVKALHYLFCNSSASNLPAIREKYSQHKYKFVAKKYCPIPTDFFQDTSS